MDELPHPAAEDPRGVPGLPPGVEALALVRRYEPVLRFTAGELFFPMSVGTYVERAALWAIDPASEQGAHQLVDHGNLDLDRLCALARQAAPTDQLQLPLAPGPLSRRQLRRWRRDPDRPRFTAVTRFAAVGLLGRAIDLLFRLSLVLRGSVPGGLVAASHVAYRSSQTADEFPYYAHVSGDGGYVVLQYWYFYAMNDWRSTFAGVNDHEADWEQVTLFLAPVDSDPEVAASVPAATPSGSSAASGAGTPARVCAAPDGADLLRCAWVAFSSHDEVGSDLRRRPDDPDITWVGTHPVVHAGAGSHSGGYLPGEYLVRVEPVAVRRLIDTVTRIRAALLPWTRDRPSGGLGIPYIDYKRGDGVSIGPGADRTWTPYLIDSDTSWVSDYPGLWGLDTDDPLGGERAPAGPRYERSGAVRESWADPVAWAGLDSVPPTARAAAASRRRRLEELLGRRQELDSLVAAQQEVVRRLATTARARAGGGSRATGRGASVFDDELARLDQLRAERRTLDAERTTLLAATEKQIAPSPHAHLRGRARPNVDPSRAPGRLLRFWSEISLSVFLALLGVALLADAGPAPQVVLGAVVVVLAIEAMLRRRLLGFVAALVVVFGVVLLAGLLLTNLRQGLGALAVGGAVLLALANLRLLLARR